MVVRSSSGHPKKTGWRHLYRVSRDGKKETLITADGNYDVMEVTCIDEKGGFLYFMASPENATQKFLYRTKLDGKGKPERLSPPTQQGTHDYDVSPNGKICPAYFHQILYTRYASEALISWPTTKDSVEQQVGEAVAQANKAASKVEFFK